MVIQTFFHVNFISLLYALIYKLEFMKKQNCFSNKDLHAYYIAECNKITLISFTRSENFITYKYNIDDCNYCIAYILRRYTKIWGEVITLLKKDESINSIELSYSNCVDFINSLMKKSIQDNQIIWYGTKKYVEFRDDNNNNWNNICQYMNKNIDINTNNNELILDINNNISYQLDGNNNYNSSTWVFKGTQVINFNYELSYGYGYIIYYSYLLFHIINYYLLHI